MSIDKDAVEQVFFEDKTESFSFMGMQIEAEDAKILAKALFRNPVLKSLSLTHGRFGDEGVKALAEALPANTNLEVLDLRDCRLTDEGVEVLAKGLARNTSLKEINLRQNQISDIGIIALSAALKENKRLAILNLDENGIGDAGGIAIADALHVHPLEKLSFSENDLGDDGITAIAKAGGTLKSLSADFNQIGDAGAKAIAQHLIRDGQLESLSLSHNSIGDDGAKAIVDAITAGSELHSLALLSNPLQAEGQQSFLDFLENQDSLASLYLPLTLHAQTKPIILQKHHKSLMHFGPTDDEVRSVVDDNRVRNHAMCERLSMEERHTVADLIMAHDRIPAIRHFSANYPIRDSKTLFERVEAELTSLPVVEGAPTRQSLTAQNADGLTPLDNGKTWQQLDKLLPLLDKSFLFENQNRDGEPLIANAIYAGKLPEVLSRLNHQGEKLTPADLLEADGKSPSLLLDFLVDKKQAAAVFTSDNWVGQPPRAMRSVYEALPDSGKAQVSNFHALSQQLNATQRITSGLGR